MYVIEWTDYAWYDRDYDPSLPLLFIWGSKTLCITILLRYVSRLIVCHVSFPNFFHVCLIVHNVCFQSAKVVIAST